jgi:hypothetical protein
MFLNQTESARISRINQNQTDSARISRINQNQTAAVIRLIVSSERHQSV